jgi:hypothetical protein
MHGTEVKPNRLRVKLFSVAKHRYASRVPRSPRVQQNVILVDAAILRDAERLIESCEHCNPTGAEIPFDWIFDRITASGCKRDGLHSRTACEMAELSA